MMAKNNKMKWTHEYRALLLQTFFNRFGEKKTWDEEGQRDMPPHKSLCLFLKEIADVFCTITGKPVSSGAVHMQIRWGLSTQDQVGKDRTRNWILNKAAAIEAGVITSHDLPSLSLQWDKKGQSIRKDEVAALDRQEHLEHISGLSVRIRQEKGVNVFEFYRDERSVFTAFTYPKAKAFALGVRYGREINHTDA
jgi:hypothetical protein